MSLRHHLLRLIFCRSSLTRILSEIALNRLTYDFLSHRSFNTVLLAGGSKHGTGSEKSVLTCLNYAKAIAVNIKPSSSLDVLADLTYPWPFRNETFDLIIATWVLEHIANPQHFLQEAYRVLKSSGCLVVAVPFIHRIHGSPYDYWRFTDKALAEIAKNAGFGDVHIRCVGGTPILCAVALLWLVLRLPVIIALVALMTWLLDQILLGVSRLLKKGGFLTNSYVISYVAIIHKRVLD